MQITQQQYVAATARGCQFQEATDLQVQTLSMQRRVFWLDGKPLLAVRSDGFYETAATLLQLIGQDDAEVDSLPPAAPEAPQPVAEQPAAALEAPPAPQAARALRRPRVPKLAMPPVTGNPEPQLRPTRLSDHEIAAVTSRIVGAYTRKRVLDQGELNELTARVRASVASLGARDS